MKKEQKIIPLENKYENKQDILTASEIEKGLEVLDQSFSVHTPELEWFEEMIAEKQEQMRKSWIRDIGLFFMMAAVILAVLLTTLHQLPAVFIAIQAAAGIFIAGAGTYYFLRQRVNEA
ncbi:YxlC family protein [Bacillus infantis]|uniref:YxlC family protein n=1 Tax=Bacillus infantis TaxID=324767 RepID=UPI001CD64DD7|nr:YxlC family protein [Bacillus infantis]MCA1039335.1 YxlC family protein [Bacillus infantis]